MARLERRLAAAAVAVVVLSVGAGTAAACDHDGGAQNGVLAAKFATHHGFHHHGLLALASAYLGVPKDQLKAQLASGKTLAQIADATPGHSAAGLVAYIADQAKAKLDRLVGDGKLTSAQETSILNMINDKLGMLLNGSWSMKAMKFAWHH